MASSLKVQDYLAQYEQEIREASRTQDEDVWSGNGRTNVILCETCKSSFTTDSATGSVSFLFRRRDNFPNFYGLRDSGAADECRLCAFLCRRLSGLVYQDLDQSPTGKHGDSKIRDAFQERDNYRGRKLDVKIRPVIAEMAIGPISAYDLGEKTQPIEASALLCHGSFECVKSNDFTSSDGAIFQFGIGIYDACETGKPSYSFFIHH